MITYKYPFLRFRAILKKEFIIMKRDYVTYIFLIILPFCQMIIFGNIINTDARHLPTVVINNDHSIFTNRLIAGFRNTEYFDIKAITDDSKNAEALIKKSKIQFIITIPKDFSRDIIKNKHPHILVEGDATDPVAVGGAFRAAVNLADTVFDEELKGPLAYLKKKEPVYSVEIHSLYNPAVVSQYHTIPGLLVTILAVSLTMLTAISITTEFDQNTMEMLFITPIKPLEVVLGKLIPNLAIGTIVYFLTVTASMYYFQVPFLGSVTLLFFCAIPYIMTSLSIGLAASTIARTQIRAVNIANAYMLPALLLSGFAFPFNAMPKWAQWLGELLPPTHFMRIIMQIMLKDATFIDIWSDLWPIILFFTIIITFSIKRYNQTLD
ncbi:ABC transporter permease [Legionella waltersii]|uniref:ABC transporter permease n=1 Tax=Legionella waltersii TaxID=66969 RepID=A0A0W1APA4_9GAMM|nr:ABC transporter permease [Legionella waltersii]KTD83102.1 ABC transporter permease [Legionella waltersii]SNU96678.1 ABC transporter permease [Legionella waltersii]